MASPGNRHCASCIGALSFLRANDYLLAAARRLAANASSVARFQLIFDEPRSRRLTQFDLISHRKLPASYAHASLTQLQ